ncbi:hypothetical protein K7X08_014732 [Anisodus acutangulus]|uniref:Uncharacterized protein n=1 Tax=Anisodus acutangulus TaxID=402998 RepID=A0A9Q1LJ09_9SOLA|nr:hypothetical protein K7X08_014732 [Anisodus acutangulus]
MNIVAKDLYSTVIYGTDAHKVWEDLREKFDKVNASRAFFLHKYIVILTYGTTSMFVYFSRLRELWDEFQSLIPPPCCPCPESRKYSNHFQLQRLWHFLMGLNKSYDHAKSQVLMTYPLPNINQTYAMIIIVESQRKITQNFGTGQSNEVGESVALMTSKFYNTSPQ